MIENAASTEPERYALRLYVTGSTPRSLRAIENIKRIADAYLGDRYTLDVIDIYQRPAAAGEHQIVASPTLVRMEPQPLRRIIGDLSDEARVLSGLEIDPGPNSLRADDASVG